MERRIFEILKDLMAMKSLSCSEKELEPAEYYGEFLRKLPYFEVHPEHMGIHEIPQDPFKRKIPYGLLIGKTKETVVLSGHFDVVSTEEYGSAEDLAHCMGNELEEALGRMQLSQDARADLESGEWLWGRGSCDMKGGLAIHSALFERYAEQALKGELEGSIIFMPVPDEESYSAGMREGAGLLKKLKERYGLNYKLMIDPEPTALVKGKQTMSIGSVGKCMPVVLAQGKKGHAGHFFDGLSAISLISDIYDKINGSTEFCDMDCSEMTMPPTWFNMRDMKTYYDASIPHRASGYFTVFSLTSTPEDIIKKVRDIGLGAFERQLAKLNRAYDKFKEAGTVTGEREIYYEPIVMTFGELCRKLKEERGREFGEFYYRLCKEKVSQGTIRHFSYPDITVSIMEGVLDFAHIQQPLILLGFAPPYYAPVHSDKVQGKEGYGSKAYEFVAEISAREFGQPVAKENYFMGISDLSYSAVTSPFDYEKYIENNPLWNRGYSIDFEALDSIGIPSVIYGPIGKEYHQCTERVNKDSLLKVVPSVTEKLVEYMWRL